MHAVLYKKENDNLLFIFFPISGEPLKFDSVISLKVLGIYLYNFAVELLGV
jgi:hypothetical protein